MASARKVKYRKSARQKSINPNRALSFKRKVLPNGITLLMDEIKSVESFSLGIFLKAGSREDPKGKEGIAHFIEHSVFRSSIFGTNNELMAIFESMGVYLDAYTTKEYTCYNLRGLKANFNKSLKILLDTIFKCDFRTEEIEKERSVIAQEIKYYYDDPEEILSEEAEKQLFGDHVLANSISGTLESLAAIEIKDLKSYYNEYYIPANMILSVAGNVKSQDIMNILKDFFTDSNQRQNMILRKSPKSVNKNEIELNNSGVSQAYIVKGLRIDDISSINRYPLVLMNEIFCDGASSRLQKKLRDEAGLAYTIDSDIYFYSDAGVYYIQIVTDPERLEEAEELLQEEMQIMFEEGATVEEISRAKEQLKSSIIMDNESMSSKMDFMASNEIYSGQQKSTEQIVKEIDELSKSKVNEIAKKYLRFENWSTTIMLPEDKGE